MNCTTRISARLAAGLTSALLLVAAPSLAWAEPTKAPKNVVDGPDLANGARNAPGAAAIESLIDTIGFYSIISCLVGLLCSENAVVARLQALERTVPDSGDRLRRDWQRTGFRRRATPSAGGLYPLDLDLYVRRMTGLADGLYRHDPLGRALIELDHDDVSSGLAQALYAYPFVVDANAVVVLVGRFARTQDKYGPRGYRYILLEAGQVAQNLVLRAAELGLGSLCLGGYSDSLVNAQLGLDPRRAGAVYLVAVGFDAEISGTPVTNSTGDSDAVPDADHR